MRGRTFDRAAGRWREILPQLGIDTKYLKNKHGPCPLCGGRDRFRFDNRDGYGNYICNQCGAGNGFTMLRKLHGWDFKTTADEIDKVLGDKPYKRPIVEPQEREKAEREADEGVRERLEKMLAGANRPDVVVRYLESRGLWWGCHNEVLRGHPRLAYTEGRDRSFYPAMLAPVLGPGGELQSIHRTYLGDVAKRKKLYKPVQTVRGAAVRLFDPGTELGIAEGIETSLACWELFAVPTWAIISTSGYAGFTPPEGVSKLIVFADNDKNFAGQVAAYDAAKRLSKELEVEVRVPPRTSTDWLDELNTRRKAA